MPPPLITLASDFGDASAFVAMLKGRLLGLCPGAQLHDLSHNLASDDPWPTAFLLLRVYPYYPAGTVHLLGLDRGTGVRRALVATAAGQHFVALDEGYLGLVLAREPAASVYQVPIAPPGPFLARDLLAGLAVQLAQGVSAKRLGEPVADWQRLELPEPRPASGGAHAGQVLHVDRFGNLITNFTRATAPAPAVLEIAGTRIAHWCTSFADAPPGQLCLLWGAEGWLEIILARASAAQRLRAEAGTVALLR